MKTLILPIGIPGCGKTTWCNTYLAPYIKVVSSDKVREDFYGNEAIQGSFREVFNEVYRRADVALKQDGIVCVDATNTSEYARSRAVANLRPERLIYVIMNNDVDRAKKQNMMRKRHCPQHVITDMAKKLRREPPQDDRFGTLVPEIYYYEDFSLLDIIN